MPFYTRGTFLTRSLFLSLGSAMDPTAVDESSLNAIQRRCLAVLKGGKANAELKEAATTMLRTGCLPSKRGGRAAAAGPAKQQRQQKQQRPPAAAATWACASCTLVNAASSRECTACGTAAGKAPSHKAVGKRPVAVPAEFDDEDRDAFA